MKDTRPCVNSIDEKEFHQTCKKDQRLKTFVEVILLNADTKEDSDIDLLVMIFM